MDDVVMPETPPTALGAPGVYRDEVVRGPRPVLRTGVPAFLGFMPDGLGRDPIALSRSSDLPRELGGAGSETAVGGAVQGFFSNGGRACYVVPLDREGPPESALVEGLDTLARMEHVIDLICAPDVMRMVSPHGARGHVGVVQAVRLQRLILERCGRATGWFAILDPLPGSDPDEVLRHRGALRSDDGALYYPWIRVGAPTRAGREGLLCPPCGHVAGVYARVDRRVGVHKAPANEELQSVVDLERPVTAEIQDRLNPLGINCLRALAGRGVRVWGARTLSGQPAWRYVNVRRLVLTIYRRLERDLASVTFEPHGPDLWARVRGQVADRLMDLFQSGALRGRTPREAFYVKCDAELNPVTTRETGRLVTEIGLAPNGPVEFVVVRLVRDTHGITMEGPSETG